MIKFPQMHIAQSVVNRILNVSDDIESTAIMSMNMPEPLQQGALLDQKLAQPTPPVEADPETTQQVVLQQAGLL